MTDYDLLSKYNVPVPRYTSYPTVPYWNEEISAAKWARNFTAAFTENSYEISVYIHFPFCESLCTYCGCNKKITNNHSVEEDYINALITEWKGYRELMSSQPIVKELHLGGGTPTFFSPGNLQLLLSAILDDCIVTDDHEFSFEGHPNNTTREHLQTLYDLGFRRVSFGVQDNDPDVQRVINRIQHFENVKRVTQQARNIGYESVNFDLIYGLPLQTAEKMERTLNECISLWPDRVAFYSYAHVPWTSKGQRLYDEGDLPDAATKMELYQLGKKIFARRGYHDIGMDHYALPNDALYRAAINGKLFRNFMGYTTQSTKMLVGLGVSAISDTGTAFAQNIKKLHDYYSIGNEGKIPVKKGYFLSETDIAFRKYILNIICTGHTAFRQEDIVTLRNITFPLLEDFAKDGLTVFDDRAITVTKKGHQFLRNICSAFDLHMQGSKPASQPQFSQAV